jgi:hypothetical protein
MSSILDRLLNNYTRQIELPWPGNLPGKQKVWFAVYPPSEERRLRARLQNFEVHTHEAGHGWLVHDLTPALATWLAAHELREEAFREPEYFTDFADFESTVTQGIRTVLESPEATPNTVVALLGLATLFDTIRISNLVENLEDHVRGRLLVFFPGEHHGNHYRFMNAREGFNYMARPITATETFLPL